jgi:hypothetical protein
MRTQIQISLSDEKYRTALCGMLQMANPADQIICTEKPNVLLKGVLVVDKKHLERLPAPVPRPERIVLVIDGGADEVLAAAWDAGLNSVVRRKEPISTAVLAILSARLRAKRSLPGRAIGE